MSCDKVLINCNIYTLIGYNNLHNFILLKKINFIQYDLKQCEKMITFKFYYIDDLQYENMRF